jgi:HlyD family secretion protein
MKLLKALLLALIISGTVFSSFGCSSSSDAAATPEVKTTTVQRGNISITVTGIGNLAFSNIEKLAFGMAGYVEEISVVEGDTVEKGQELVKLNTSDWEDQLKTLNRALISAQRALNDKEIALASAQRQVNAKALAVDQAEINLQTAEYNLGQIAKVKSAQNAVNTAENNLNLILAKRATGDKVDYGYIHQLQDELADAQANLQRILNRTDTSLSTNAALEIAQKQLAVEQGEQALEDAKAAAESALTAVKNADLDIQEARLTLEGAQIDMDEANSLSPIITAPFNGFITKVNTTGGDEVNKGTIAIQMADPEKMEARILVTESDIFSITLGGEATVSADALPGLIFPARVTAIAPTATISSGVVNYSVVVELTSLQPVMPVMAVSNPASIGEINPSGSPGKTASDNADSSHVNLKDGLSATVTIPIDQKENVLIIPSRAVTRQGQNSTVQVMKGTMIETRIIKTGLSDSIVIEIIEGLEEGEQVLVRTLTSTASSYPGRVFSTSGGPPVHDMR